MHHNSRYLLFSILYYPLGDKLINMKKNNHPERQKSVAKAKPSPLDEFIAELRPGQSLELLQALHILTREGKLNQDSRRKLKQITHLYQFIEKALLSLPEGPNGLSDRKSVV